MNVYISGRTVHNRAVKVIIVLLGSTLLLVLSPVLIPLHFVLRSAGRRGFTRWSNNGLSIRIVVDHTGFYRR